MADAPSRSSLPPIGILEFLPESARAALAACGKFSTLPEGFFLMKQGDPQDLLCILISGKLSATAHSDSSIVELGMIMPGESVGEMNVIDPKRASADVKSVITSRVWSISKEALDQFVEENPVQGVQLLRSISIQLCRRIRRNSDKMLRQLETASTIYEWLD
jgi:CRP/FNR family transcriptional regulator, cyclic AMP receptor protein